MQTIEKALHQPMPFTTGGQTISDRLTAAKHSLAGSQLGKTICKATTEELMAPKKKHLDYLLHCTNEPNVSIPSMANTLIERTQSPNWTIVYKALITIHNIMCYGNERFSQYLASCNTTFNLGNFLDKQSTQAYYSSSSEFYAYAPPFGYDMSQHVRRYGKYIGEKIGTYRLCAFDFCKVKRGREDGLLRTMHTDKLLKTLPILQNQIDALLEFEVSSSELSNGVINCSFILLFRDLIRLFACYNDGIINLLEKYFDMNKKQCREALDMYKGFLTRLDKVSAFLRVAESVGIDRGEIPDLTRAPASLLEALEAHLHHLEGGRGPPPVPQPPQQFSQAGGFVGGFGGYGASSTGASSVSQLSDTEKQRVLDMENERMRQFEEQRKGKQEQGGSANGSSFNPFATQSAPQQPPGGAKTNDDLLDLFSQPSTTVDPSNPFAAFQQQNVQQQQQQPQGMYPNMGSALSSLSTLPTLSTVSSSTHSHSTPFNAQFSLAFATPQNTTTSSSANSSNNMFAVDSAPSSFNPFATGGGGAYGAPPTGQWNADFGGQQQQQQWGGQPQQLPSQPSVDEETPVKQTVTQALGNPFGAMQGNAHAFGAAGVTPQLPDLPNFPSTQSSSNASPISFSQQSSISSQPIQSTQPLPIGGQQQLGIYEQTPFSKMDGSYTAPTNFHSNMQQLQQQNTGEGSEASQPAGGLDPLNPNAQRLAGDVDSALSSLADNLSISGQNNQGKPVQWGANGPAGGVPARPPQPTGGYQQGGGYGGVQGGYGGGGGYGVGQPMGGGYQGGMQGGYQQQGQQQQQMWSGGQQMGGQQQQPNMYGMQQPAVPGYGMYAGAPVYPQQGGVPQQAQQAPPTSDSNPFNPFS